MKHFHVLYEKGDYRWAVVHKDPHKKEHLLDSNEYMISYKGQHLLLDPGGFEIFPTVLATLVQHIDPMDVKAIFASHQDPDIASSLSLWQEINPQIKCYISWLWTSFVPHFGGSKETFVDIPDEGMDIDWNGLKLKVIAAHHLHSAGNCHLYDPQSKIYFSGDTGAALLPEDNRYLFVESFEKHIPYIEGFHRRWFGSNEHKNNWCDRALTMDIKLLCPQHGAIYVGDQVKEFIHWLRGLNVGQASNQAIHK